MELRELEKRSQRRRFGLGIEFFLALDQWDLLKEGNLRRELE